MRAQTTSSTLPLESEKDMEYQDAIRILRHSNALLRGQMDKLKTLLAEEEVPVEAASPYDALEACQEEYDAVELDIRTLNRAFEQEKATSERTAYQGHGPLKSSEGHWADIKAIVEQRMTALQNDLMEVNRKIAAKSGVVSLDKLLEFAVIPKILKMMERHLWGNSHPRCGVGEKLEMISKTYLSLFLCFDSAINAEDFASKKSAIFLILPEEDPSKNFMAAP